MNDTEPPRWWDAEDDRVPSEVANAAVRPTTFALPISLAYWRASPWPDRPHP
jgi:hypothetical protein